MAAAATANAEETLPALVQRIWNAYRAGDIAEHNHWMAEDYIAVHPDGSVHGRPTKEQILAAPIGKFSLSEFKVAQLTDGVALLNYVAEVENPPERPAFHFRWRVGEVWKRIDGEWRLRYYQPTPLPLEPSSSK